MTTRDIDDNKSIPCPNCGNGNTAEAVFCGKCGLSVSRDDKPTIPLQYNPLNPPPLSTVQFSPPPVTPVQPIAPNWALRRVLFFSAIILLIGSGLFAVAYQLGRNSVQGAVNPPLTATAVSGTTPTTASGLIPTMTQGAPPTPSPTNTPTPTPTKSPITLTCSGCPDSIRVTITMIHIDTVVGNVSWNIALFNRSGDYQTVQFDKFTLQDLSGQPFDGSGHILTTHGYGNGINPGQTAQGPVIFSFVPEKGVAYQLIVKIHGDNIDATNSFSVDFDPITIIF